MIHFNEHREAMEPLAVHETASAPRNPRGTHTPRENMTSRRPSRRNFEDNVFGDDGSEEYEEEVSAGADPAASVADEEDADWKTTAAKKKRAAARPIVYSTYRDDLTEGEKDTELKKLAREHFGANTANGLKWQNAGPNTFRPRRDAHVQLMKCAFAAKNCCEFKLEVVQHKDSRRFCVRLGDRKHADHNILHAKRGIDPVIERSVDDAHLQLDPTKFCRWAKNLFKEHGLHSDGVDESDLAKLKEWRQRRLRQLAKGDISDVRMNQLGGLRQALVAMRETELAATESGFDFHTPYLVGGQYIAETVKVPVAKSKSADREDSDSYSSEDDDDEAATHKGKRGGKRKKTKKAAAKKKKKRRKELADTTKLAFVISSKNLLANVWRQQARGSKQNLCIDTTYRVTVEGFGIALIGVTGLNQKWHAVAFCLVSKESKECLEFCLRMIKADVEHLVRSFARAGLSL